ncbi:hypothetical protein WR25_23070 [Diploscapter pachys]|uniref:Riboflavin transporter n=1 Tax=Diploscapter pachys TaxID=2018661 RepID=A0A2A2KZL3_9BILA|nr:hypothetical protein WR25_23070 [Diploscapter pachys]
MEISIWTFILVVVFGSCSWLGTNSVWMELPLLTSHLPEGWNLPSYLAADVQIACAGPLLVSLLHRLCPSISLPRAPIIIGFIVLACLCQISLSIWWDVVARVGSGNFSVCLYAFLFGLAFVDSVSNVLFLPFMAQYNPTYLNAYFVGMGLSALIPSLLSLAQGTANYKCVELDGKLVPDYLPPRFHVSAFFFIVFCWTCITGVAFILLYRSGAHNALEEERVNEGTPLNDKESVGSPSSKSQEERDPTTDTEVATSSPRQGDSALMGPSYIFLLLCTALVNAQMNGIIPSIQSYAALPYSRITAVILAAAFHSYLRVVFASLLREGEQSASRLFWCGVFIQIGSFFGSVIMFPLVNIFKLFTPAPPC